MLPIKELRKKLLAQRRELFRAVAQIEDELLWLETDVESEEALPAAAACLPCAKAREKRPA